MKLQLAIGVFCLGLTLHAQTALRLAGSTTVKGALEPRQSTLESAVGRRIEFAGTGTATGLLTLLAGDADVAMLSSPLDEVAGAINARQPGRVDVAKFNAERIGEVKIVFIVNPRNRVRTLSAAQIADVLTGKIGNWKEVGGDDAPIVVVSLANGGPLLQEKLLHGQAITVGAHAVPNATQIPAVVAANRDAIGIISTSHARGQTSVIQTDATIIEPLFLVTKGPPTNEVKKLVDTARRLLGGT